MLLTTDRRRLAKLRQEGYLGERNPLSERVTITVLDAAHLDERPQWLEVFLVDRADGTAADAHEVITDVIAFEPESGKRKAVNIVEVTIADETTEYAPKSPADEQYSEYSSARVLANWLRHGLGARVLDVAAACDVSKQYASEVRVRWEPHLRALLNDALCLGISGEDLYHAWISISIERESNRLVERLRELRVTRENEEVRPRSQSEVASEFESKMNRAWSDYRAANGCRGNAGKLPVYPPRWFVRSLTESS